MTLTQLEYVVAVATYKSFVAAAEKTFVTQPTLSMQINKLEEELNIKIFDRYKHPIVPTEVGLKIVEQAKIILAEAQKIDELIHKSQGVVSGSFTMAVIPTIAPTIIPKLLEIYSTHFPNVTLSILEAKTPIIIEQLKNNEIDCGLLATPLEDNRIKEIPLFYEPLVAYFNKEEKVLKKRTITPEDIDLSKIWLMNEGNCLRNQVLTLCNQQVEAMQADRPYKYESGNVETLRKMVDRNGGLSVFPELSTLEFEEEAFERIRYFSAPEPVREISIVTNEHFVKMGILQSLMDTILSFIPEKMRVQRKDRKILRIQSSKL